MVDRKNVYTESVSKMQMHRKKFVEMDEQTNQLIKYTNE